MNKQVAGWKTPPAVDDVERNRGKHAAYSPTPRPVGARALTKFDLKYDPLLRATAVTDFKYHMTCHLN